MPTKISQLTNAIDVTANDLIQIVDVEDGVMAPSGTNKKATASLLANQLVPLIADASINQSKLGPVTATGSTTARSLANRFADVVNVKDFGAVGDGVTDDTVAIQAAISAASGGEVILPADNVFLSGPLTVVNTTKIRIDGILKMKDASGTLLRIDADDCVVYGLGTVNLNNTQDKGIQANGDRFAIWGLTLCNMLGGAATAGSSSALNITTCSHARVKNLKFKNIQKGTAQAPFVSHPRGISLDFVSNSLIEGIIFEDVYVAVAVGAVTKSTISDIVVSNTLASVDNCFYVINSSDVELNNINIYNWPGEPIVFSGCTNVRVVGGSVVDWSDNSLGFENCTDISIDGMRFESSATSTIIKSRTANATTTGLSLRNLSVRVSGTSDILGFYNGAVNDLIIKGCSFNGIIDTGMTLNNRFLTLTSTNQFAIEDNVWMMSETSGGVAAAADWLIVLAATAYSSFRRNTFLNRTTNGRIRINGTENNLISSDGLHNQANISGSRNPNYNLTTSEPRRFFGTGIPSAGTFIAGDVIWNTSISSSAGPVGWVCVTAGTPGAWTPFGSGTLTGSSTYNPPSLSPGTGVTTTVTVTGAALGDTAIASFGLDLQGITITAYVSAADTVTVRLWNDTSGTLDIGQDAVRVRVFKA